MFKKIFLVLFMATLISESMSQSLRVMTYNIRLDHPVDSVNQWPRRADKVYALIKKYNPDILGVQEALHHQMEDLMKNLPGYAFVGVGRDDGKTKGEYSAIFYNKERFSVIEEGTFWLSETPDVPGSKSWDAAITRIASWARLKDIKSGKAFLYMNTHFDHIGKVARERSSLLLKEKATALQGNLPAIISGDFNSEPTDASYKTMVNNQGLLFSDSRPASSTQGTFCSFGVNTIPCKTIDYIFLTKAWKVNHYQVITDNDGKYYPSDHLPVICDVTAR